MSRVVRLLLLQHLALLQHSALASSCSSLQELSIESASDLDSLQGALRNCSDASFAVSWEASLTLAQTIAVGNGNTLEIATTRSELPTVDGNGSVQLFYVESGASLALQGLRLANGYAAVGGGAVNCSGSLTLDSCTVESCQTLNFGGGVYVAASATAVISDSNFTSNIAGTSSGALEVYGAVNVSGSRFMYNEAPYGGAIYVDPGAQLALSQTIFEHNSATEFNGGAILNQGSSMTLLECDFAHNRAAYVGGALYTLAKAGDVSVVGCAFDSNYAEDSGGGVYSETRISLLSQSSFTDNTAKKGSGGALFNAGAGAIDRMDSCIFSGNVIQEGGGGGIFSAGDIAMYNTSISFNEAATTGAGIYSTDSSSLIAQSCHIQNNTAADRGGGLFIGNTSVLESCHVSGNVAQTGGGAFVYENALLSAVDSVFAENEADNGAALYLFSNASVDSVNSTFRGNQALTYGTIFIQSGCTQLDFTASTFESNGAAFGGAVFSESSISGIFSSCSFSNCSASEGGAAIFVSSGSGGSGGSGGLQLTPPADLLTNGGFVLEANAASCCHTTYAALYGADCASVDGNTGEDSIFSSPCCTTGQYAAVESDSCEECPAHFDCGALGVTLGDLPLAPGYWRASNSSTLARACWNSGACLGGSREDAYCKPGYTGPYCAACESGYASGVAYACHKCSSGALAAVVAALCVGILAISGCAWYIFADRHDVGELTDGASTAQGVVQRGVEKAAPARRLRRALQGVPLSTLRVPLVVWQIITQFVAITGVRLPPVLQSFFAWLNAINLDLGWVLSVGCIVNVDFYGGLLFVTIVPLAVLALLCCSAAFCFRRAQRPRPSVGPLAAAERVDGPKQRAHAVVRRHVAAAFAITFLIYSTVSTKIFQVFACDTFAASEFADGHGSESFLRADYSVSCDTAKHRYYQAYAGVMIAVYPLGIPMAYAWTLWRQRNHLSGLPDDAESVKRQAHPTHTTASFLSRPYVPSRFWWELLECLRRLCLTGLLVFILPGTSGQAAVACVFAVGSLAIFARFAPMREPRDSQLYILGCAVIFVTMFIALLIKTEATDPEAQSQKVLGILVVVLNVVLAAAAVGQCVAVASAWSLGRHRGVLYRARRARGKDVWSEREESKDGGGEREHRHRAEEGPAN